MAISKSDRTIAFYFSIPIFGKIKSIYLVDAFVCIISSLITCHDSKHEEQETEEVTTCEE